MAITLDTIVNKVFKVVKNGYDNNEVEAFLDEILEEMENREAETEKLKEKIAALTGELEQAKAQLAARPAAAPSMWCLFYHTGHRKFHSFPKNSPASP